MKKSIIVLIIQFLLLASHCSNAQTINGFETVPISPKPSFESLLQGTRAWEFGKFIYNGRDMQNANGGDFGYAYVVEEVTKYMHATIPDANHGSDYRGESTTQLIVDVNVTANTYLRWNGVWTWNISCSFVFSPLSVGYYYSYEVSDISVAGNNFGDHSLFNRMLKKITKYVYHHSKQNELHLPKTRTGWNEQLLRSAYSRGVEHPCEGIYEDVNTNIYSNQNLIDNRYKLGVKNLNNNLFIIYLYGANLFNDWEEGELKAVLETTATPNIYKAKWIGARKNIMDGYVTFEQGAMKVILEGEQSYYLKLYPNISDLTPVQPDSWSGTGFALNNGHIATNYHVIEDAKSIIISGINGDFDNSYSAIVVGTDKVNDIAILKISDSKFSGFGSLPYAVNMQMAEVGDDVFVLGYPLTQTMGDEIKLTNGIISSRTGFQGDASLYQMSAPIQPGNSGGPMFDNKGNVIGIICAHHKGTENVGYAIKTSYLKNLAESSSLYNIFPKNNTISTLSLSGKVKKLKNYVYLIKCSSSSSFVNNSSNNYNNNTSTDKTYSYPSVSRKYSNSTNIISVVIRSNETVVTLSCKNDLAGGWMNIDRNAYIIANGRRYLLTGTEGIEYSPNYTYFSYRGESKTFKLHFPPIPNNTSSIDFIESETSEWRFYGIELK